MKHKLVFISLDEQKENSKGMDAAEFFINVHLKLVIVFELIRK